MRVNAFFVVFIFILLGLICEASSPSLRNHRNYDANENPLFFNYLGESLRDFPAIVINFHLKFWLVFTHIISF